MRGSTLGSGLVEDITPGPWAEGPAQGGMIRALGMSSGGSSNSGGDRLAKFVAGRIINPFIPKTLIDRTEDPIFFRTPCSPYTWTWRELLSYERL